MSALHLLWLLVGVLLLLTVVIDALWTTLWVDGGAGPVASRLTTWTWRGVLSAVGRRRHRTLSLFGPASVAAVVVTWVLLLWTGWVFVFAADPGALLSTRDYATPAGWGGRIFFVAYSMFTMGNGDYAPQGTLWQLVASVATGSGFFVASLVISYILSIVGAVGRKRALASEITGLGLTPAAFLESGWDGSDFRTLDLPLSGLSSQLANLSEQYLAYPVLQYYHAARAEKSPAVGIVILDEALTILRYGVPEPLRPNAAVLRSARAGVGSVLETLDSAFIRAADEVPPAPDLGRLRAAGVPLAEGPEFAAALEQLSERRRRLLGMLRTDGWNWPEG